MKKLVLSLVLLVAVVFSASASNPEKLITQLSKENNVTNVKIGGFLMAMAKPFMLKEAGEGAPFIKGVKSIHVMAVDGFSEDKRNDYLTLVNELKDTDGYETLVQVKDGNDHVRIMVKTEKDKIKGMYIFTVDDHDLAVVKLLGNISQKEIEKMMEKYSEKD